MSAVIPCEGVGYFVPSATVEGYFVLVTEDGCTCPARTECWHIFEVRKEVERWAGATTPTPSRSS